LPIGNAAGLGVNGYSLGMGIPFEPNASGGPFGGSQNAPIAVAHNTVGKLAICFNYNAGSCEWSDLSEFVDNEAVNDFDFDYGSGYFAAGRDAAEALGLYVLTIDGTSAHVWYFSDILRSSDCSQLQSYTLSDTSLETEGRIACSETYPDLVLVGLKDATGTRYGRSTDGGASFGSLTRVGSVISDSNDNAPFGMAVDGQRQLISAPDATPVYGVYYASTSGGAFAKLSNSEDSTSPQPFIAIAPDGTTAYVSSEGGAGGIISYSPSDAIPYGTPAIPADYPMNLLTYTTAIANYEIPTLTVDSSGGNPGYCGHAVATVIAPNTNTNLTFYLFAQASGGLTISNIKFDYKINSASGTATAYTGSGYGNTTSLTIDNAWHSINWTVDVGAFSNFTSFTIGQVLRLVVASVTNGHTVDIYIDNVEVTTDVPLVGDIAQFYKVTNFTSTNTWTDISPTSAQIPSYPHALTVDKINTAILNGFTENGNWYRSSNSGTSWTNLDTATNYRAAYTVGDAWLIAGDGVIALSMDGGESFRFIAGNLDNVWNGLGIVKKAIAL